MHASQPRTEPAHPSASVNRLAIETDRSLLDANTLRLAAIAERYVAVDGEAEIEAAARLAAEQGWPVFVLGGGSNLVLTERIPGLVVHPVAAGLRFDSEAGTVTAEAGAEWHALVMASVARGLAGLENLALIPGSAGAAPVQNIGAYGVELADRFVECRAWHLPSARWETLSLEACEFAYRHSRFKRLAGEYVIASITLGLSREPPATLDYASLAARVAARGPDAAPPTPAEVARMVIDIRRSKLPDPAVLPNAGSFFKNPIVPNAVAAALRERFPELPAWQVDATRTKLAAGWLIDRLGLRGCRRGAFGVHELQALVLVHHAEPTDGAPFSRGSARDLLQLADEIRDAVRQRYDLSLEIEPLVVDAACLGQPDAPDRDPSDRAIRRL